MVSGVPAFANGSLTNGAGHSENTVPGDTASRLIQEAALVAFLGATSLQEASDWRDWLEIGDFALQSGDIDGCPSMLNMALHALFAD